MIWTGNTYVTCPGSYVGIISPNLGRFGTQRFKEQRHLQFFIVSQIVDHRQAEAFITQLPLTDFGCLVVK